MQDDAALRANEIAAGLPQVRFLDHGRDAFEPTRWDPGGRVVFAEQPPRLRRVSSQYAICVSLGRLVEEPDACPRRKTVLALQEDRYAHGRTQLAVGSTVMRWCRSWISLRASMTRSPSSTLPPAESRKRTTRFKVVPYLPSAARTLPAVPATIGPDKSI